MSPESIKATLTFRDPKELRFFTRTDNIGGATVQRLKERKDNRDKSLQCARSASSRHPCIAQKPSDLTVSAIGLIASAVTTTRWCPQRFR